MIIAFSGTDGSGKSTQIEMLMSEFRRQGFRAKYIWARGGYTPLFSALKKILRILTAKRLPDEGNSSSRDELLKNKSISNVWLTIAIIDLSIFYGIYVRIMSWFGTIVICDRYIEDTLIDFKRNFPDAFDVIKASKKLDSLKIKHTLKIAGMSIDDSVSNAAYSMNRLQKNVANNEAISYLGLVTGLEKYELLSRSHIFILPSYYSSEAIPLSIIEAMRMGCVIITTNFRYLPDLVKNNINGYLVRVKNSTDIVNIVMDIFNDKDQFEIISKYNISYAKKYYSEDRYRLNIIKQVSNDCSI